MGPRLLVLLLLAGCGGDHEKAATLGTPPATTEAAAAECVPAASDVMAPLGVQSDDPAAACVGG